MRDSVRGLGFPGLVLLLGAAGAAALRAQDPRDAQVARAFNEFDAARRVQLLMSALNPTSGPPRGAWPVGVQLLAQTLIEDGKDSAAAVWLRWAIRLSPDLQPDTVQFLPAVVAAYRAARDFVMSTRGTGDSVAATTWLWPAQTGGEQVGRLQVAAAGQVPVRVDVRGVGPIGAGGSIPLNPGSYQVSAGSGSDNVGVTREVLPGVTTVLEFRFRPALPQVATKPPPPPPPPPPEKKGGFPVLWVGLGGVAAVAIAVVALGHGGGPAPAATGSISVPFPNP
jgi:hypothetical protein